MNIEGGAVVQYQASYRWLGGVYYSSRRQRFRLYWTDYAGEEAERNTICVCHSMEAEGTIIGILKVPGAEKHDRVNSPE